MVDMAMIMSYQEIVCKMRNNLMLYRILSGSALKVIAVVSMTIDHIALFLLNAQSGGWVFDMMRCVGRLAFPIFAFLIVEGYFHTKCFWKYMLALLITAVVSEIPWQQLSDDGSHNVIFTLLFGLVAIYLADHTRQYPLLMMMVVAVPAFLSTILEFDYAWRGVCLTVVFYLFRERRVLTLPFGYPLLLEYGIIGPAMGLAVTLMYSGRRGFVKGCWLKYLFYIYYPLHLIIICIVI